MSEYPQPLPPFDYAGWMNTLGEPGRRAQRIDDGPLLPAPPSGLLGVLAAWIIIALSVLTIFGANLHRSRAHPTDITAPTSEPNVPFELVSRYAVGAAHVAEQTKNPSAVMTSATRDLYVQQAQKQATTTVDQARLITVVAAVQGKDAALSRLEKLQQTVKDPALATDLDELHTIYTTGAAALTPAQRHELVEHHGWFGRLALAWGAKTDDPDARAVQAEAARTFVASTALSTLGLAGIVAGLVLFVVAMVLLAEGRITRFYRRAVEPTSPFLEAFAVYVGGSVLLALLMGRFAANAPPRLNWLITVLGTAPVLLALPWPLLRGVGAAAWRRGLGWHAGTGLVREMGLGLVGYIAGLPVVALGAGLTWFLTSKSGANPTHPIINEARGGAGTALRLYLLASLYAPLVEESLFRGALFHHLRGRHGWWISSLLVSLIFAAMHPQGWAAIPTLGAIALVFAAIREWRGTILASVAAHALNNAVVTTVLILSLS